MPTTTFIFFYILVVLDVLFIANHCIIRTLRDVADRRVRSELQEKSLKNQQRRCNESMIGRIFRFSRSIFRWLMAFIFDIIPRTEETTRSFPQWREIPYSAGRCMTATLILLAALVLSNEAVLNAVGVSFQATASANFCVETDFDQKMALFRQQLDAMTNLPLTRRQHNYTLEFHKALVADTALYGVEPFECKDVDGLSGNKSDWADPTVPPSSENGPFFPGYCAAALNSAIASAKSTTCYEEKCACIERKFGFLGTATCCWCGKVCVNVPYACPQHADVQEAEVKNYRVAQLERAEEMRQLVMNETLPPIDESYGAETASKILWQIDIAGTLYAFYSSLSLFFPSPLQVFRMPLSVIVKRSLFGVDKYVFILFVIALWWGVEYFQQFITPDVGLYFVNLLRDPCLLDAQFLFERHKLINEVCEELVPMHSEFSTSAITIQHVLEEVQFFVDSCDCAFPNQNLASFERTTLDSQAYATEIGFGREIGWLCGNRCTFMVPDHNMTFLGNTTLCVDTDLATRLAANPSETDANWWQLWIQTGLVAQILIKFVIVNFGIALYRFADPLSACGGTCLWPAPASFSYENSSNNQDEQDERDIEKRSFWGLPKFMTNMVFVEHTNNSNEGFETEDSYLERLGDENTMYLRVTARKWAYIWGIIAHWCLINFAIAIFSGKEGNQADLMAIAEFIAIPFVIVIAVFLGTWVILNLITKYNLRAGPSNMGKGLQKQRVPSPRWFHPV